MGVSAEVFRELIFVSGMSPRRVALNLNIDTGAWSHWLKYETPGKIGKEKLERVANYLGLNFSTGDLLPGVHKWQNPGADTSNMQQLRSLILRFFPGGGVIYPTFPKILFDLEELAGVGKEKRKVAAAWVLLPNSRQDVRIILEIAPSPHSLSSIFSPENLGKGWTWPSGSVVIKPPRLDWKIIETGAFTRLFPKGIGDGRVFGEESLTVPDLDAILGISGSSDWTWERVNSVLESKGITPEETARKMGIL